MIALIENSTVMSGTHASVIRRLWSKSTLIHLGNLTRTVFCVWQTVTLLTKKKMCSLLAAPVLAKVTLLRHWDTRPVPSDTKYNTNTPQNFLLGWKWGRQMEPT